MRTALARSTAAPGTLDNDLHMLNQNLLAMQEKLGGNQSKNQVGEKQSPTVSGRLNAVMTGTFYATYGPTPSHERTIEIARKQFQEIRSEFENILTVQIPNLEKALQDAGAPWFEGQAIPKN